MLGAARGYDTLSLSLRGEIKKLMSNLIVRAVVTGISDVLQQHVLVDVLRMEESHGVIQIILKNFPVQETVFLGSHHKVVSVVLETVRCHKDK